MHSAIVVALLLVAALIAVAAGSYYSRRQTLEHRVGAFQCRLYRSSAAGYASLGVAQYGVRSLVWFRRHSLSLRPARVWPREDLHITTREMVTEGPEVGMVKVLCHCGGDAFTLLMSRSAYQGLAGWLEAGPLARGALRS